MNKYYLLFFVLFLNSSFAQNKYKEAEGFYNLSGFEVSSGLYLLKNTTFFYYSMFGNVDLKIYGNYSISDQNKLKLIPNEELKKEFYLFGLKNNQIKKDIIILQYNKPFSKKAEKLFINTNTKLTKFPEFKQGSKTVSINLKLPKSKKIQLEFNKSKTTMIKIVNDFNDIKIYHNYYANMVSMVSKMSFNSEKGTLTNYNSSKATRIQKKEINDKTKEKINNYIESSKKRKTITRKGKIYTKI